MSNDDDRPDDGAGGDGFEPRPDLGPDVDALLADPALWQRPSDELAERVVAAVRSEAQIDLPAAAGTAGARTRPWVRPALLGAAAVVVFFVGGVTLLSAVGGTGGGEQVAAALEPSGLVSGVDGEVVLRTADSGVRIELDAPSLPRRDGGGFYEAWVLTDDGRLVPCGTFHDGERVTLWAGVDLRRVVRFTITMEHEEMPDSAEQRTSGDVVLAAELGD